MRLPGEGDGEGGKNRKRLKIAIAALVVGAIYFFISRQLGQDIATAEFGWPVGVPICRSLGHGLYEIRSNLASHRTARVIFCAASACTDWRVAWRARRCICMRSSSDRLRAARVTD